MAAKRIRCICGKVYSPEENKACPACGTEVRIESISVIAPESDAAQAPVHAPAPFAAVPPETAATPKAARKVSWVWIAGGVWLAASVAAMVLYLLQPDPNATAAKESGAKEADAKESGAKEEVSGVGKMELEEEKKAPAPAEDKPAIVKKGDPPPADSGSSGKQWIVEAGLSEEAGGAALVEVLGKAVEGDTILLKPGTYAGEFTIGDGIRLAGEAGGAAIPVIKMATKRNLIEVNLPGATIENLRIILAGEGNAPGLKVAPNAKLVVTGCEVQATGGNCLTALPTSSVTATKSVFISQTGIAVQLLRATGQFTGCGFSNSRIGISAAGGSKVELNDCTFEKCGPKNGPQNGARAEEGYIVNAVEGGDSGAGMGFTDCKFTGNTGGIFVAGGVSATLTKCAFSGNGFAADAPLFSKGLLAVGAGGKAVLSGVTFQGDRQGVGAFSGGLLEMTDCHLTGVGLRGSRKDIRFTGNSVFACGKGAVIRLKQCEIADTPGEVAAFASDGGAIEAETCEFRKSDFFAVYAGTGRNEAPCRVVLKGGRIVNSRAGLKVATGGSGSVDGTEFRQNGTGIEVTDPGTSVTVSKAVLAECSQVGLFCLSRADASLRDCSIENNAGGGVQVGVTGKPEARADLAIENCRIGSNAEFDVKAATQSRLTVTNCTWTSPGQRPKLVVDKQTITQFEPPLDGLASGGVMPAKKSRQPTSHESEGRSMPPQRSAPSRTPPHDPVGQAIDTINRIRRMIR